MSGGCVEVLVLLSVLAALVYLLYKITCWAFRQVMRILTYLFREDEPPTRDYGPGSVVGESLSSWSGNSLNDILTGIVRRKLTDVSINYNTSWRRSAGFAVAESTKRRQFEFPEEPTNSEARQISEQIAAALRNRLQKNVRQFEFPEEPTLIGSAADGTMIPGSGDYDYLVYMRIPVQSGLSQTHHQGEGFWKVEMTYQSEQMKKLCAFSNGAYYLNLLKVHTFLVGEIEKGLREINIENVSLKQRSRQAGPSQIIEVSSDRFDTFTMDFVPCLTISGRQLVGKLRPDVPPLQELDENDPRTLEWRQSFSTMERDRLKDLDEDWKNVLRLVKCFRHNKQAQFQHFNSFIYKNVFLYLLDDSNQPSGLGKRFLSYMKKLESFLKSGELNHYYLWQDQGIKRNLLKPYGKLQIENVHNFVHNFNKQGENAWGGLLEKF